MALSPIKTQDDLFDYIDEPEHIDTIYRLIKDAGLDPESFDVLAPLQDLVALGKLDPKDIPARLVERLKMDGVSAETFAKTYARELLYPMKDVVPSVAEVVKLWGEHDVRVQKMSANQFVHAEVEKYHLELPSPGQQKTFERVLSEFVAGRRTREETLEALSRPRKVGGLGFDKHASEQLLEGVLEDAKHVPPQPKSQHEPQVTTEVSGDVQGVSSKNTVVASSKLKPKPLPPRTVIKPMQEQKVVLSSPAPLKKEEVEPVPQKKTFDPTTLHPDHEREVEEHKKQIPVVEPLHNIEAVTQRVMKGITALTEMDAEKTKKLHAIVKTRLKGIRDAYKTRAALESVEAGLGFTGGILTSALEQIEKAAADLDAVGDARAQKEKQVHVEKRAKRFVSSVPPVPPSTKQSVTAPVLPQDKKDVSVAPESKIPPPLRKKGKVRDVVSPRKLSGPIEELAQMTISDFRRLGSTGEEAAAEITERIKLLEAESYGRRLKGITSWRRSPLYETYVSVISEAMRDTKSLGVVLQDHKAAGVEMLTLEEVQALIRLNGTLRV